MKNLKIIIIATTIAILTVATVGIALAFSNGDSPYYGMNQYSSTVEDDDWWTEMREHMEERWNEIDQTDPINDEDWWDEMIDHMKEHWDEVRQGVQDEEWFKDMRAYMEQHTDEVQNQDWFEEMLEFMQEHREEYSYRYNYPSRSYGRGCWGG